MTTLYVAGPMTGLYQFNYPAFFEAEQRLRDAGYVVLNPARIDEHYSTEPGERTWQWYMRHALQMLIAVDHVALLPDWEGSRGATLEVRVGRSLGMDTRPVDQWLERAS